MLGLFGSLSMGARSLQTQQQGVEVAGHNLANVNNPAYTRQRLQIATALALPSNGGWQGTGSTTTAINQLRDVLLDRQAVTETSVKGSLDAQLKGLQFAETYLGEQLDRQATGTSSTSSTSSSGLEHGISSAIGTLFASFQSLSTQPTSLSERQVLLMNASDLATKYNSVSSRLTDLNTSLNDSLNTDVTNANTLLTDIAHLNDQINKAEMSTGSAANDLRDLRQQKLEDLSKYTPVTATTNGSYLELSIGGQSMVSGTNVLDTLQTYDPGNGQLQIRTATGGQNLTLTSGSIGGTIDIRDGAVAQLRTTLDASASALITVVNNVHKNGFGLNGTTNADFFTGNSAGTISVNSALLDDPALLQASGVSGNKGDNQTILAMAQLADTPQAALGQQTFSQHFNRAVAALGQAVSNVTSQQSDQEVVLNMVNQQRSSVSGVSLDEEMTDMMKFQKAYTASAKLVSTIDEMLDIVMNMKR